MLYSDEIHSLIATVVCCVYMFLHAPVREASHWLEETKGGGEGGGKGVGENEKRDDDRDTFRPYTRRWYCIRRCLIRRSLFAEPKLPISLKELSSFAHV